MCLVGDCFFLFPMDHFLQKKIFFNVRGNFYQRVNSSLKGFKLSFVLGKHLQMCWISLRFFRHIHLYPLNLILPAS